MQLSSDSKCLLCMWVFIPTSRQSCLLLILAQSTSHLLVWISSSANFDKVRELEEEEDFSLFPSMFIIFVVRVARSSLGRSMLCMAPEFVVLLTSQALASLDQAGCGPLHLELLRVPNIAMTASNVGASCSVFPSASKRPLQT